MFCPTWRVSQKCFKKHMSIFHIKEQTLLDIKEAEQMPIQGSFLSRLHKKLGDPNKLEAFEISCEAERDRRGQDVQEQTREAQWCRFEQQVIQPYITGLETTGAFHVLRPQLAGLPDDMTIAQLQMLATKIQS